MVCSEAENYIRISADNWRHVRQATESPIRLLASPETASPKAKRSGSSLTSASILPLTDRGDEGTKKAVKKPLWLRSNKMITKLDNCNHNKGRHRWSKQNVHESVLLPAKEGFAQLNWCRLTT